MFKNTREEKEWKEWEDARKEKKYYDKSSRCRQMPNENEE